jgi:nucleotide-binding universal stress UspA family protein
VHIREILCPVDFSDPSREALHFAADLAAHYRARLTLLNVYSMPGYALPEGIVVAGPEVVNRMIDDIETALSEWKREAGELGAQAVRTMTEMGTPQHAIVETARRIQADIIVIGTHGRTGFKHVLLGSVAEKVVRTAPCPVLTVRPSDHHVHLSEDRA